MKSRDLFPYNVRCNCGFTLRGGKGKPVLDFDGEKNDSQLVYAPYLPLTNTPTIGNFHEFNAMYASNPVYYADIKLDIADRGKDATSIWVEKCMDKLTQMQERFAKCNANPYIIIKTDKDE